MKPRSYRLASHGGLHRINTKRRRHSQMNPYMIALGTISVITYTGLVVASSVAGRWLAEGYLPPLF